MCGTPTVMNKKTAAQLHRLATLNEYSAKKGLWRYRRQSVKSLDREKAYALLQKICQKMQLYCWVTWLYVVVMVQQHYTVRRLAVMAQCACNGHNVDCRQNNSSGSYECVCGGNTTGRYCDTCLPFYNHQPFRYGVPCEGLVFFLLPTCKDNSNDSFHPLTLSVPHFMWLSDCAKNDSTKAFSAILVWAPEYPNVNKLIRVG